MGDNRLMCGRFVLTADWSELAAFFGLVDELVDARLLRRYNVAPTQTVGVVPNRRERRLRPARWGLVPPWAKDEKAGRPLINARAETLAEKPAFREAFRLRRCLVPASGFYEWARRGKDKRPHLVRSATLPFLAFAGIWNVRGDERGERRASVAIVTCASAGSMAELHERSPVMLRPDEWVRWLDPAPCDPAELAPLLEPRVEELEILAVGDRVNAVAHDDPECLRPREEA